MTQEFSLFDHTADLGISARGASKGQAIAAAVDGLYAAIGSLVPGGDAIAYSFEAENDDLSLAMHDLLTDALLLFEDEQRMLTDLVVTLSGKTLVAEAQAAMIDEEKSDLAREVKAITYHELKIEKDGDEYVATVIVDI